MNRSTRSQSSSSSAPSITQISQAVVIGLLVALCLHILDASSSSPYQNYYQGFVLSDNHFEETDITDVFLEVDLPRFPAYEIVQAAYSKTFSIFDELCDKGNHTMDCIKAIQQENREDWPWWFHTMMRDAVPAGYPMENRKPQLFGFWHQLHLKSPRLTMCVIEKIGTKHWRKLQCKANNMTSRAGQPCQPVNKPPPGSPQTVFLRDPLERFLSGFLDKCVVMRNGKPSRMVQKHCNPRFLQGTPNERIAGLDKHNKQYLELFVDTMPLEWDVHFFPQALYCDGLFQHIQDYDFVGMMGPSFYDDMHRFGERYGKHIASHVDTIFDLESHVNTGDQNQGVETSAVTKLKEYYSPTSLRKVLQFMAFDYVALNMPIPAWANEMLLNDMESSHDT